MLKTDIIQKALVFNKAGEVLILRRSDSDTRRPLQWDFPGGVCEDNELMEEGAFREIREETGLEVDNLGAIYTKTEHRKWDEGEANVLFIFYKADAKGDTIDLSYEHNEYQWVDLKQAPGMFEYYLHKEVLNYVIDNQLEL